MDSSWDTRSGVNSQSTVYSFPLRVSSELQQGVRFRSCIRRRIRTQRRTSGRWRETPATASSLAVWASTSCTRSRSWPSRGSETGGAARPPFWRGPWMMVNTDMLASHRQPATLSGSDGLWVVQQCYSSSAQLEARLVPHYPQCIWATKGCMLLFSHKLTLMCKNCGNHPLSTLSRVNVISYILWLQLIQSSPLKCFSHHAEIISLVADQFVSRIFRLEVFFQQPIKMLCRVTPCLKKKHVRESLFKIPASTCMAHVILEPWLVDFMCFM